jgi:AmiR/NasT family two-component response regulator
MRLRDERIGALNLFANQTYGLIEPDEVIAQAMADVATIGILHERFIRQREEVSEQLRAAFNSRVALEQAKGIVAEATGTDVDEAFALMRGYTRRHRLLLSEVARQVISRDLAVEAIRSPSDTSLRTPR